MRADCETMDMFCITWIISKSCSVFMKGHFVCEAEANMAKHTCLVSWVTQTKYDTFPRLSAYGPFAENINFYNSMSHVTDVRVNYDL